MVAQPEGVGSTLTVDLTALGSLTWSATASSSPATGHRPLVPAWKVLVPGRRPAYFQDLWH